MTAPLAPEDRPTSHTPPVAYRWRAPGNKHWIYDPTPEWIEDHKHEIELEPLYAQTPAMAERVKVLTAAFDRQCDNMAFVLNHAALLNAYYERFSTELAEDRAALASEER